MSPAVKLEFLRAAENDLNKVGTPKHLRQISAKLDELAVTPQPADARPIKGTQYRRAGWNLFRVDVGEYRIVYDLNEQDRTLTVVTVAVIGPRNDDKVYRLLERRM